jgi:hypothetical protein
VTKNRMVSTKFWSDNWIVDELNPLDRYLYLYLLTNEHCSLCGIYEISLKTVSFETGIEKDEVRRMLERLSPKVHYTQGWIYLVNYLKHASSNPNMLKGAARELNEVPENILREFQQFTDLSGFYLKAFETLSNASEGFSTLLNLTLPNLTLHQEMLREESREKPSEAFLEKAIPKSKPDQPEINMQKKHNAQIEPQPKIVKHRDALFEAVCNACGSDWNEITNVERARLNKAVKELRDAGATPEDVKERAMVFQVLWPNIKLTAMGLVGRWSESRQENIERIVTPGMRDKLLQDLDRKRRFQDLERKEITV